jgi:acyl-CoA reductase-like NAD-dependent aldehyde dehydrogenase
MLLKTLLAGAAVADTAPAAVIVAQGGLGDGLAAYVYGPDLERAWSIAERLEFGAVGIPSRSMLHLQTDHLMFPRDGLRKRGLIKQRIPR